MNPNRKSAFNPYQFLLRHSLFTRGAGVLGGLTLLSSGFVAAQTDTFVDAIPVSPPSAPAQSAPNIPKPQKTAPTPAPQVNKPSPAPAPVAQPKPAPNPAPVARPNPAPSAPPVVTNTRPSPAPSAPPAARPNPAPSAPPVVNNTRPNPAPSAPPVVNNTRPSPRPSASSQPPETPVVEIPSNLIDSPSQLRLPNGQNPTMQAGGETNTLVDTASYGAPQPRAQQRPNVVLSERGTGCSTVVRNGQLTSARCGAAPERNTQTASGGNTSAPRQQVVIPRSLSRDLPPSAREAAAIASTRAIAPSNPVSLSQLPDRVRQQISANPSPRSSRVQVVTPSGIPMPGGQNSPYNRSTLNYPRAYPNNGNTSLLFPLSIPARIGSAFGWRIHPIHGTWRLHAGTDIPAPQGTPVLAAYHGEVALAGNAGGYGLMVILRHEQGSQESRYAHLSQIFVSPGQWIEQGEVIGLVGSTGQSTGPHLHFEWRHLIGNEWIPVDAGPHLEYAMAQMLGEMDTAQTDLDSLNASLNYPLLNGETLGQRVLNSGIMFLVDPQNRPPSTSEELETDLEDMTESNAIYDEAIHGLLVSPLDDMIDPIDTIGDINALDGLAAIDNRVRSRLLD
ncbi:M23 family metallopeptidase [Spirulina subsalsa]|uniref:M23 family metallopeptidase n=1 Tax=Spirulina subsalsa TaxID=54311 RepID=UPI0002F1F735|nr:peptidoglycan DD-metalloendopeptidase family protein [Spirulina subsalsa]